MFRRGSRNSAKRDSESSGRQSLSELPDLEGGVAIFSNSPPTSNLLFRKMPDIRPISKTLDAPAKTTVVVFFRMNRSEVHVDESFNTVAVYVCEVQRNAQKWIIYRRFSQIYDFDIMLRFKFPDLDIPKMPKRSFFKSGTDTALVNERMGHLETYLNSLAAIPAIVESDVFTDWIQPFNDQQGLYSLSLFDPSSKSRKVTKGVMYKLLNQKVGMPKKQKKLFAIRPPLFFYYDLSDSSLEKLVAEIKPLADCTNNEKDTQRTLMDALCDQLKYPMKPERIFFLGESENFIHPFPEPERFSVTAKNGHETNIEGLSARDAHRFITEARSLMFLHQKNMVLIQGTRRQNHFREFDYNPPLSRDASPVGRRRHDKGRAALSPLVPTDALVRIKSPRGTGFDSESGGSDSGKEAIILSKGPRKSLKDSLRLSRGRSSRRSHKKAVTPGDDSGDDDDMLVERSVSYQEEGSQDTSSLKDDDFVPAANAPLSKTLSSIEAFNKHARDSCKLCNPLLNSGPTEMAKKIGEIKADIDTQLGNIIDTVEAVIPTTRRKSSRRVQLTKLASTGKILIHSSTEEVISTPLVKGLVATLNEIGHACQKEDRVIVNHMVFIIFPLMRAVEMYDNSLKEDAKIHELAPKKLSHDNLRKSFQNYKTSPAFPTAATPKKVEPFFLRLSSEDCSDCGSPCFSAGEGLPSRYKYDPEKKSRNVVCRLCEEEYAKSLLKEHTKYCEEAVKCLRQENASCNEIILSLVETLEEHQQQFLAKMEELGIGVAPLSARSERRMSVSDTSDTSGGHSSSGTDGSLTVKTTPGSTRAYPSPNLATSPPMVSSVEPFLLGELPASRSSTSGSPTPHPDLTIGAYKVRSKFGSLRERRGKPPTLQRANSSGVFRRRDDMLTSDPEPEDTARTDVFNINSYQYVCSLGRDVFNLAYNDDAASDRCWRLLTELHKFLENTKNLDICLVTFGRHLVSAMENKYASMKEVAMYMRQNEKKPKVNMYPLLSLLRENLQPTRNPLDALQRKGTSLEDFDYIKPLSQGAYGRVCLAMKKKTKEYFAIKIIEKEQMSMKNMLGHITAERDILANVLNPFIVKLFYAFQNKRELFLVMEYCPGGDLSTLLKNQGCFPEQTVRVYAAEVILALDYLHKMGYVHRDLKPENLLVNAQGHIVLTDFGLSDVGFLKKGLFREDSVADMTASPKKGSGDKKVFGTPDYLAPEILLGTGQGPSVDWWALGVMIYEFFTQVPPFNDDTPKEIFNNILSHAFEWPRGVMMYEDENGEMVQEEADMIPPLAKDLIEKLLNENPAERLGANGAEEVMQHPFFEGINWSTLINEPRDDIFIPVLDSPTDVFYFEQRGNTSTDFGSEAVGEGAGKVGTVDNFDYTNLELLKHINLRIAESTDPASDSDDAM